MFLVFHQDQHSSATKNILMKRIFITSTIFALLVLHGSCIFASLYAQTRQVQHPFDFSTQFEDVYIADNDLGFAVGDCGILARTTNAGMEWTITDSPEGREYKSVICQPGTGCQTVILAGGDYYARSTNSGQSWTVHEEPGTSFSQLEIIGNNQILAVNNSNTYRLSSDGGASWTNANFPASASSKIIIAGPQVAYYFHRQSSTEYLLYKTNNAGQTWQASGYSHPVFPRHISFADQNIGFMLDNDRNLLKTNDGGSNWLIISQNQLPFNLTQLIALSETEIRGIQISDRIHESHDGGSSWTSYSINMGNGVFIKPNYHQRENEFWLVSNASEIYYSPANFTNFQSQIMAERYAMGAIAFQDDNTGYAVASGGRLYKTTNAGADWNLHHQLAGNRPTNAYILPDGRLWIGISGLPAQVSSDGGNSFSPFLPEGIIQALEGDYMRAMAILPNGRYLLSGNTKVVYSDNQGSSWQVVNHNLNSSAEDIYFYDNNTGFIAGSGGGRMIKTTDGGLSWQLPANFPSNQTINTFHFSSPTHGIAFGGNSSFRTSDGGDTWQNDNSLPGAYKVSRANNGDLYVSEFASGNKNASWRSQDNGQNWQQLGQGCAPIRTNTLTPNNRYYFAAGDGGLIERYDLDLVNDLPSRQTNSNSPLQVYPNPSQGRVSIELPPNLREQNLQLAVFKLQGQLQSQQIVAANSEIISLDLQELPKGMYLLRLEGKGSAQHARIVIE